MAGEYYLKPPKEKPFYRILLAILALCGLAKNRWWDIRYSPKLQIFVNLHGAMVFTFVPVVLLSLVISLFQNYNKVTFATLGIMLTVLPVSMLTLIKTLSSRLTSYEKLMRDFHDKIHLYSYYMRERDDFVKSKLLEVEKYSIFTGYFIGISLIIDWCSWIIVPIVNNFQKMDLVLNKTMRLQTCVYTWMPFDYSFDYQKWALVHCLSAYLTACGCTIITVFDTMNFAFVFNLIGHIKILKHSIQVRFTEKKLSIEEQKKRLTEIMKYHAFIVQTFRELQSAFGMNVAGNYLQNLLEDSLLLYQLMFAEKGDKIAFGMMLLVYMGELIIMSFILEEQRIQTDELPEVLYSIPWEKMSISNQKIFKLILMRVQTSLSFEAACGLKAGVKPMMSILKSTFSYFVMLKSNVEGK